MLYIQKTVSVISTYVSAPSLCICVKINKEGAPKLLSERFDAMQALIFSLLLLLQTEVFTLVTSTQTGKAGIPIVVNTWPFVIATETAWLTLRRNAGPQAALDAIEQVVTPP